MINTIIHDVDGVLKDWLGGFCRWMQKQGYMMHGRPGHGHCYEMEKLFPGIASHRMVALIEQYNASPAFEHLDDVIGALDGVEELYRRFPGIEHVAITAAGTHPHTLMYRASHILDFGIERAHILPMRADKTPFFKLYPGAIVIEDSLTALHQARAAGCIPICIRYSYNDGWDGFAVDSWSEIPDLVERLLGVALAEPEGVAA